MKIKGGVPKVIQLQDLIESLEKAISQEKQKSKEVMAQLKDK